MSAGSPSVYFHPQAESRVGRDVARDCSDRSVPAPAPFWTVPSTDQASEMESMYARPPYVRGGSMQCRHGMASPPSVLQSLQRTEMRPASVHLPAAVPFSRPTGHAPQAGRFPDAAVRQFDCSRPGSSPFRPSPNLRADLQSLGNVNSPSHGIAEASALGFTPANQTWGEMLGTTFTPRTQPSLPSQVRSWESSEPTGVRFPSVVSNNASSVEPTHSQNANDDASDEVHTFLCEWTDEHGTCNMDILGDRVWMSRHLSRHHNVVGNERSQRACLWRGCTDTMNKGSLARHVVSRHLRAGASCGFCSKVYSRADVARRHTKKCKVANGVSVQYEQTGW